MHEKQENQTTRPLPMSGANFAVIWDGKPLALSASYRCDEALTGNMLARTSGIERGTKS